MYIYIYGRRVDGNRYASIHLGSSRGHMRQYVSMFRELPLFHHPRRRPQRGHVTTRRRLSLPHKLGGRLQRCRRW